MNGESQFSESFSGRIIKAVPLEPAPGSLEAETERDVFICVAKLLKELADFLRALPGGAGYFQRSVESQFTGRNALE